MPRFRGYQQQDAHEFLRYMLDRLHTELLCLLPGDVNFLQQQQNLSPYSRRSTAKSSSHSLVTSIFGGTLQSEVTCLSCKTSSKKHDPFLDLSIDIPSNFSQFRNKCKDGDDKRPICTLYGKFSLKKKNDFTNLNFLFVCISDCLQKFVDIEELAESERFFCNNCKSKQRSTKKFWVRRLPNVSVYTKHKTMEFSFCIYLNSKSICLFFQLFFRRSYVCILNVFDGAHIPERKLIPT